MAAFTNAIPTASTLSLNVSRLNAIVTAIEVQFTPASVATPIFERGDSFARDRAGLDAWFEDIMTVAVVSGSYQAIPPGSTFELNIRKLNAMFTAIYAVFV